MVAIITLLVVVMMSLIVNRIATVALTFTGLSRDSARFQARSAFSGAGFTTSESELILDHPVRRKIIMLLMLLGNVGLVTLIATLMGSFVGLESGFEVGSARSGIQQTLPQAGAAAEERPLTLRGFILNPTPRQRTLIRILALVLGVLLLWLVAASPWVDTQMSRVITWALKTFTSLDTLDYHAILHLSEGYTVNEFTVGPEHWVTGKSLIEIRLSDEGINVLGVLRADKSYVGSPTGHTYIRKGDTLLLYGYAEGLHDIEDRMKGEEGDRAHERSVEEQRRSEAGEPRDERSEERLAEAVE